MKTLCLLRFSITSGNVVINSPKQSARAMFAQMNIYLFELDVGQLVVIHFVAIKVVLGSGIWSVCAIKERLQDRGQSHSSETVYGPEVLLVLKKPERKSQDSNIYCNRRHVIYHQGL